MKLANGMTLDILINGDILPLEHFGSPQLQIDESDQFGIPILCMRLIDNTGGSVIKQFSPLPDASLLAITITSGDASVTREFRVTASIAEGAQIIIRAYLNHPNYVTTTSKKIIRGTSSEALKQIADQCSFAFTSPQTADSMIWQPVNQRLINFARHIVGASYVSDESMMVGRITLEGEMRVRNLAIAQPTKGLFGYSSGAVPIFGFQPEPQSQVNIHGGYKQVIVKPSTDGSDTTLKDMPLVLEEVSLNRNPKVAQLNPNGSVKHLVKSHSLNEHANYTRAIYNNERANFLFSMKSKLLINNTITNMSALDTITLALSNKVDGTPQGDLATVYDGDWVMSSRSIFIEGGQYYERFSLMRMGLGVDMHSKTI